MSEQYSWLKIDAVGPLMPSSCDNKYLIMSYCVALKYLDAIPVQNWSSMPVIQALIQIFYRSGYLKEIQWKLGRSFSSELSTVCYPQSNSVERLHSTLKKELKVLYLGKWTGLGRKFAQCLVCPKNTDLKTIMHENWLEEESSDQIVV